VRNHAERPRTERVNEKKETQGRLFSKDAETFVDMNTNRHAEVVLGVHGIRLGICKHAKTSRAQVEIGYLPLMNDASWSHRTMNIPTTTKKTKS
jgi:hypothetical protein